MKFLFKCTYCHHDKFKDMPSADPRYKEFQCLGCGIILTANPRRANIESEDSENIEEDPSEEDSTEWFQRVMGVETPKQDQLPSCICCHKPADYSHGPTRVSSLFAVRACKLCVERWRSVRNRVRHGFKKWAEGINIVAKPLKRTFR